jgi:hypothetical protein
MYGFISFFHRGITTERQNWSTFFLPDRQVDVYDTWMMVLDWPSMVVAFKSALYLVEIWKTMVIKTILKYKHYNRHLLNILRSY